MVSRVPSVRIRAYYRSIVNIWIQRLQAHDIHPRVERLIYLTEEEFKFLKRLKVRFCKRASRFFPRPQKVKKEVSEKAVERRFQEKQENDWAKSRYKTSDIAERRKEALYWSWQRVKEHYREMTIDERYEKLFKEIKI